MNAELGRLERIVDACGQASRIEALLPAGVRPRQLQVRTLLLGMLLVATEGRPAHLRRVHQALLALSEPDRFRLGVIAAWKQGPHTLTYRQLEYTFARVVKVLSKAKPDGSPSETLSEVTDALLEASVSVLGEPDSSSYAVDWTDHESWSRPPPKKPTQPADAQPATDRATPGGGEHAQASGEDAQQAATQACADPEAAWGHRTSNHPATGEMFFGYYLQAVTTVKDEHGPEVPELVRRIQLTSCRHDPAPALVPVIERMHNSVLISDLLADSGYSYRVAESWALPLRALGAQLIIDLHPQDRGPHGTHQGAIIANGALYCPATPTPLLELSPLHRGASPEQTDAHDRQCQQLHHYKLSPITGHDPDGYHRAICPAAQGKIRCPLREASMTLAHDRPTVLDPPRQPPVCCAQQTITVPPAVNAKTTQKHDYPSREHRRSYNRRSAAERTFATTSDPATNDLSRGFCRMMGLTPIALFTATALIARNIRIADAFNARQAENERRRAAGLPPKSRRRRRQTIADLIAAANAPPPPAALAA